MREIEIQPMALDRLAELLPTERAARFQEYAGRARGVLADRTIWNVNATAQGGGVAEMLQSLLAYARGAHVDTRWLVLSGDHEFFTITKRLHNMLHGAPGDGLGLTARDRSHFEKVLDFNLAMAVQAVRPGDVVLLHDPQPAALVDGLRELGAHVVWRCHIGQDVDNEQSDEGWAFLRPYLQDADGFIFSRQAYVPDWVPADRVAIIPPSIDPFSTKNEDLTEAQTRDALAKAGLVGSRQVYASLGFTRRDGSPGHVRPHRDLIYGGGSIPGDARLVMQVSRWDRLKDMPGVMRGFTDDIDRFPVDVHLALVGPDAAGVSDDPEGAEVLADCRELWSALPPRKRQRVHLVCLPMDDIDENAHLVNALQHHAAVVVQKSLREGFGLTVTEAMWKSRPMVASAVGGIQDQIDDGVHGLLLHDPEDLAEYAKALARLVEDPPFAERLGRNARARVIDQFLGDRHLIQYAELFVAMIRRQEKVAR